MKKICMKCGKSMDISNFPVRGNHTDGTPSYRNYCRPCWNEIRRLRESKPKEVVEEKEDNTELLIKALADYTGFSTDALSACTKEEFVSYTGYTEKFSFTDLKSKTFDYLDSIGIGNPFCTAFDNDGCYLVVGDTYGQHTRSGMFALLNNICKAFNVNAIIFVGKQTDENDTISNCFSNFSVPVVFVASAEEIATIHKFSKEINASVVRDHVTIGNVTIRNQEQISPYVKKSISSLDTILFNGDHIVNCTRMEYAVRNRGYTTQFIASPGSVAEPFVPKLRNKLLIKGGIKVAQVYSHSFKKYRKAEEDKLFWEQGCVLVNKYKHVVQATCLPIKKVNSVYTTALSGVVIDECGQSTEKMKVVVSDIHAPYIDKRNFNTFLQYLALNSDSIEEVICAGDIVDCRSLNPHILKKGEQPEETFSETLFSLNEVLYNIKNRIDCNLVLMLGNHSDFMMRWANKNPQFKDFFTKAVGDIADQYADYVSNVDELVYTANDTVVLHGNTFVSASGSTNTEKYARAFNGVDAVIIGHSHSTNVRFGCIRIGCMCEFDQGYNSPYGAWDCSFATITTTGGVDFVSPLFITNGFLLDGLDTLTGMDLYEDLNELVIHIRRD